MGANKRLSRMSPRRFVGQFVGRFVGVKLKLVVGFVGRLGRPVVCDGGVDMGWERVRPESHTPKRTKIQNCTDHTEPPNIFVRSWQGGKIRGSLSPRICLRDMDGNGMIKHILFKGNHDLVWGR